MSRGRPIRILHVVGGMNRGGVETWLMNVLRHIDRERFRMDFLVHTDQPCTYDDEILAMGSRIIPCLHPNRPLRYAKNFSRSLRKYGPYDVIHSHMYWFSGFIVLLASWLGIPNRVIHTHPASDICEGSWLRPFYINLMCLLASRNATMFLYNSQSTMASFSRQCIYHDQPEIVIPPVIDLDPFARSVDRDGVRQHYHLPLDMPIAVYVARFYPHKNHHGLLRIADVVNRKDKRVHFVMVGSHGPLLDEIKGLVSLRDDATILDTVEDIAPILLASDLFIFPSEEEGFGIVALEAQAAGLPCVLSEVVPPDVDVVPSLIHRLPLRTLPDAWAEEVLACTECRPLSQQEALKQVRQSHFDIHECVRQLEAVYEG